jgi:hypothetical protein
MRDLAGKHYGVPIPAGPGPGIGVRADTLERFRVG